MIVFKSGKPNFICRISGESALHGNDKEERIIFKCRLFSISKCIIANQSSIEYKPYNNNPNNRYWRYTDFYKFYIIYI